MKLAVTLLAAGGLSLAVGCGEVAGSTTPRSAAELGERYGACDSDPPEHADPVEFIATVEQWSQVLKVDAAALESAGEGRPKTSLVTMTVADTRGPETGKARSVSLLTHSSMLAGIADALSTSMGEVYVGYSFYRDGPEKGQALVLVPYVVVTDGFYVPGHCLDSAIRRPLEARYGETTQQVLQKLRISPPESAPEILGLKSQLQPTTERPLSVLGSAEDPGKDLKILDLFVSWPHQWTGRKYLLCSLVASRGVGPCIALETIIPEAGGHPLSVYVDGDSRAEFVLLPDDGTTGVLSTIGTVFVNGGERVSIAGNLAEDGSIVTPSVTAQSK